MEGVVASNTATQLHPANTMTTKGRQNWQLPMLKMVQSIQGKHKRIVCGNKIKNRNTQGPLKRFNWRQISLVKRDGTVSLRHETNLYSGQCLSIYDLGHRLKENTSEKGTSQRTIVLVVLRRWSDWVPIQLVNTFHDPLQTVEDRKLPSTTIIDEGVVSSTMKGGW